MGAKEDLKEVIKPEDLRCTRVYPNPGEEQLKKVCSKIKARAEKMKVEAQSMEDPTQSLLLYARWEELHFVEAMLNAMIDDLKEAKA